MTAAIEPPPPLRLLYVIDSLGSGGAQRQVVELAKYFFGVSGVNVSVLIYRPDDFYREELRRSGVAVERVEKHGKFDPSFPFRLARKIGALAPDLVHAFLPNPCLWTLCALRLMSPTRRPLFVAAERSSLVWTDRILEITRKLIYRNSDAVTVNAACVKVEIADTLGIDPGRISYLPNGIDLERWRADAAMPPPWPIDPDRFHLALVGGYRPEKNHAILLEALAHLPREQIRDWQVWFIGDATAGHACADSIREAVTRMGLDGIVRMVPATSQIAAVMNRMHGVLLPSAFEGFPNVALEAMALGVPVLANPVGDVPNLIEEGRTGFLLSRLDAADLAEKLLRLRSLTDAERAELCLRVRQHVEARFEMSHIGRDHLEFYRRLVTARVGSTRGSARARSPSLGRQP